MAIARYNRFFSIALWASMMFAPSLSFGQSGPTEDDSQTSPAIEVQLTSTLTESKRSQPDQTSSQTDGQKDKQFADQFWTYLLSNNYKHWAPLPGKPADAFATEAMDRIQKDSKVENPHTRLMKVYMNRTAASNPSDPPIGSVLVMENLREDRSLESISVMYRTEGFNPNGNDWYWVNYNPDGSVTTASEPGANHYDSIDSDGNAITYSSKRVSPVRWMGRASSCMACHQKSTNADYAFFNDPSAATR